jgi:deoxyuridine 5'-triphosphate nucleotidohydrolase
MNQKNVKIAPLFDDCKLPTRKTDMDAGFDLYLYAPNNSPISMYPNYIHILHTGITIEMPKDCFGWITNKSSSDYLIGGGIIDPGYQGELLVKLFNTSSKTIVKEHGDAIAQLIIMPRLDIQCQIFSMDELHTTETERGKDGGIVRNMNEWTFPL